VSDDIIINAFIMTEIRQKGMRKLPRAGVGRGQSINVEKMISKEEFPLKKAHT